jgi:hypothetical protein
MMVSFIGGGNRITWRKLPTCHNSLKNLSHKVVTSIPCHELDSNSQENWSKAHIGQILIELVLY